MAKLIFSSLIFLLFCVPVALAEVVDVSLWEKFTANAPEFLISLVPFLLSLMILCRAVSEVLFVLKDKIPGDWDNRAIKWLQKIAEILARVLGQIGIGMPRKMVLEKAAKAEENSG